MKQNPYQYTVEKLTNTLECLVIHPGDVRERLTSAFLSFQTLQSDDLSPEYRNDWNWVLKELKKYGPLLDHKGEVWRGSVENTMRRVRKSTVSKIAKKTMNCTGLSAKIDNTSKKQFCTFNIHTNSTIWKGMIKCQETIR